MDNILELKDLTNFDFSKITLGNPTLLKGNNYYTKTTIGSYDKNIYLQMPKCKTKQGIITTSNKKYCDLVYNASDTNIIDWFENLEQYFQTQIYNKRDLWFHSAIQLEDIQELMTPIMRSFKSGKNILIRTHIKNKCPVYDENETPLSLENFRGDEEIIPLLLINGIKFSSENFFIDIFLSQMMVITPQDELESQCLIKKSASSIKSIAKPIAKVEDKIDEKKIEEEESKNANNVEDNESRNDNIVEDGAGHREGKDGEEGNDPLKMEEVDLDERLDLDSVDESMNLKSQNEIYYELYKTALQKAKDIRKNAIEAFLSAKDIKVKYGLDDLTDSDESDFDEAFDEAFDES